MKKDKDISKITGLIFIIITAAVAVFMVLELIKLNVFPIKYLSGILTFVIITILLCVFLIFIRKCHKAGKIISVVISLLMAVVIILSIMMKSSLSALCGHTSQNKNASVIVLTEDEAKDVRVLHTNIYGCCYASGRTLMEQSVIELTKDGGNIRPAFNVYNNHMDLVNDLLSGNRRAILFNESARPVVEQQRSDFNVATRIVAGYEFKTDINVPGNPADTSKDCFTIYISGDDNAAGGLNAGISRLNIIAAVNPQERRILLVTLPSDMLVSVKTDSGYADELLKYAASIGADASLSAMEQLIQQPVDYYAVIHFDGRLSSYIGEEDGINLNSNMQQLEALKSIKADWLSPGLITNYSEYSEHLSNMLATTMPYEALSNILKNFVLNSNGWKIDVTTIMCNKAGETGSIYNTGESSVVPEAASLESVRQMLHDMNKEETNG